LCGIVGSSGDWESIHDALNSMSRRGPDSSGVWKCSKNMISLGHVRLAIQDVTHSGAQPMESFCGRYVIVFNGEIYNHSNLRSKLSGENITWNGSSDTETLINCISMLGVQCTLNLLVGMFAFALWDKEKKQLTLARDRMGEKPLYWGWAGDTLLFSSELKALKSYPGFKPLISRKSLALYLKYSYVPTPHSIYEGIHKLPQGHYVTICLDLVNPKEAKPVAYWSLNQIAHKGINNPFKGNALDAVDALEWQLKQSISDQMLADVPLGAFLSGGVDSSLVVSLMQELSVRPVKTYTIGFEEKSYNEAEYAKSVAKHIGTEHIELYVKAGDALSVIPDLPTIYCEPFADSSQIPTFLVSQLARTELTVALSGDGGDELFGGYNRYLAAGKIWAPLQRFPYFAKQMLGSTIAIPTANQWNYLYEKLRRILPEKFRFSMPGEKLHKLATVLSQKSEFEFYNSVTTFWENPYSVVVGAEELVNESIEWQDLDCIEHSMMLADANTYMADDVLVKVDRAGMAASLETRVPMLDHRVVELAWQMPIKYKIQNGQGKWLLREILYRRVPRNLIERPKAGFSLPLDSWLKGPLRDWAETLLESKRLESEGYFQVEKVRKIWNDHLSGKSNNQYNLWVILMFQAWLEKNS